MEESQNSIKNSPKSPELPEQKITRLEREKAILDEAHLLLLEQIKDLESKAYFDRLTGLKSRLAFDEEIKIYFDRIFRKSHSPEQRKEKIKNHESLVFVIFDIDRFKSVNDTLGHQGGDIVLKKVSETIRRFVRDSDLVARWGGEEIVVAFIDATKDGAEVKTDFIRQKIEGLVFDEFPEFKVTVSAGLAHSSEFTNQQDLFKAADDALYKSKKDGRNRVTSHS